MEEDRVAGSGSSRIEHSLHHSPADARSTELRSTAASSYMHAHPHMTSRHEGLQGHSSFSRTQSLRHIPSPPEQSGHRKEKPYATPESSPPVSSFNSPLPRPAPSMSPYSNDGHQHRGHKSTANTVEANATPHSSPPTLSHLRKMHHLDLGNVREGQSRVRESDSRLASEYRPHDSQHRQSGYSTHSPSPMPSTTLFSGSQHYRQSPHSGETGAIRARASPPMPPSLRLGDSPSRSGPQADRARLTSSLNPQQPSRLHRTMSDHGNSSTPRGPITVQFQETPKAVHGVRNHAPPKLIERTSSAYSDGSSSDSERHRHRSSLLPSSSSASFAADNNARSASASRHLTSTSGDISRKLPWSMPTTTGLDTNAYGFNPHRQRPQAVSTMSSSEPSRNRHHQLPPIRTTPNSAAPVISMRRTEAPPGHLRSNREADTSKQRSNSGFADTHEASNASRSGNIIRELKRHSPDSGSSQTSRTSRDLETRAPPPSGAIASPRGPRERMCFLFLIDVRN